MKMGEGDDKGCDGWIASPTWWTWVWAGFRSWWWAGKPAVLQSMGFQGVRHDWATLIFTFLQTTREVPERWFLNFAPRQILDWAIYAKKCSAEVQEDVPLWGFLATLLGWVEREYQGVWGKADPKVLRIKYSSHFTEMKIKEEGTGMWALTHFQLLWTKKVTIHS